MITSPADRRLMAGPHQIADASCTIRASAFGATPIAETAFRIDDGEWYPMYGGDGGAFCATTPVPDRSFCLSVRVTDQDRHQDIDTVEVSPLHESNGRKATGSDAGRIGAWPERHLLGTQRGPNRNGKKW